jgi:hypothetical protein
VKQLKSDVEDLRGDNDKKTSKILELRSDLESTKGRLRDAEASLLAERSFALLLHRVYELVRNSCALLSPLVQGGPCKNT